MTAADALLPARALLERLIALDSTSARGNLEIAAFAAAHLEAAGLQVERWPAGEGRVNLLAWAGTPSDDPRRGLLLCGHLDVVPALEPEWRTPAFALHESDGCFVGRGTADMKGFVALAMHEACAAAARGVREPLALLLTADEELGSLGAQAFAHDWPRARALPRRAIIGEPTSLRVVRMHKGHAKVRYEVHGRAAHSGSPHLGANAIEPAGELLRRLAALRAAWAARRVRTSALFAEVPFPVLNVATIRGGEAANVVPERCTIDVGVRLLPGQDAAEAFAELAPLAEGLERPATFAVLNDNPPMELPEDDPWHRELCAAVGQAESVGVSYASDAGVLRRDLDLACVLWGPGTIEVAHRPNEALSIDEWRRAGAELRRVVGEICGTP